MSKRISSSSSHSRPSKVAANGYSPSGKKGFGYSPQGQVNVPSQAPSLPSASDKPSASATSGKKDG